MNRRDVLTGTAALGLVSALPVPALALPALPSRRPKNYRLHRYSYLPLGWKSVGWEYGAAHARRLEELTFAPARREDRDGLYRRYIRVQGYALVHALGRVADAAPTAYQERLRSCADLTQTQGATRDTCAEVVEMFFTAAEAGRSPLSAALSRLYHAYNVQVLSIEKNRTASFVVDASEDACNVVYPNEGVVTRGLGVFTIAQMLLDHEKILREYVESVP